MLWVVTVLVLGFAFFPNYVGVFLKNNNALAARNDLDILALKIDGMTCQGCAVYIEKSLLQIPGVKSVSVIYEEGKAVVYADSTVEEDALRNAVKDAGYTAASLKKK